MCRDGGRGAREGGERRTGVSEGTVEVREGERRERPVALVVLRKEVHAALVSHTPSCPCDPVQCVY